MNILRHSWFLTLRLLRHLLRQPWYIAFTVLQPIIWLVLYGQLFQQVVNLPGFHARSYVDFLTPGVVIMSTLFAAGWSGMGVVLDIDRGVMDRFLVSPVNRLALILSRLMNLSIITLVQALILSALGSLLGARYEGGILGLLLLLFSAVLLGIPFGALSVALAVAIRKEESVIGAVNFVLLPLTFTAPLFMANGLMPRWMQIVSRVNPVKWSVEAGRAALHGDCTSSYVWLRIGCLIVLGMVCTLIARRAFRGYERSA